MIIVFQHD